ncbi:hypothetical protein BC567DRAFT_253249 [Phyllosticta citribraziliensis]
MQAPQSSPTNAALIHTYRDQILDVAAVRYPEYARRHVVMYTTHDAQAVAVKQTALVMYQETYHHRPARIIFAPTTHPDAAVALRDLLFEVSRDLETYLGAFVEQAQRAGAMLSASDDSSSCTDSSCTDSSCTTSINSSNSQLELWEGLAPAYAAIGCQTRRRLTSAALGQVMIDVRVWQNPDYYADYPAFVDLYIGLRTTTATAAADAFQPVDLRGSYQQVYPRSDSRSGELMFRISYRMYGVLCGAAPLRSPAYVLLPVELDGERLRPCCVYDRWEDGVLAFLTTNAQRSASASTPSPPVSSGWIDLTRRAEPSDPRNETEIELRFWAKTGTAERLGGSEGRPAIWSEGCSVAVWLYVVG